MKYIKLFENYYFKVDPSFYENEIETNKLLFSKSEIK